jgi:hypothetical protein
MEQKGLHPLPDGFIWELFEIEPDKTNPEFYCDGDGHSLVGIIKDTLSGNQIYFYCDGEMRINYLDRRAIYSDQLPSIGINNDHDLMKIGDIEAYDIINNPWFDLYFQSEGNADYEHMDVVHFNVIEEGVPVAIELLKQARTGLVYDGH